MHSRRFTQEVWATLPEERERRKVALPRDYARQCHPGIRPVQPARKLMTASTPSSRSRHLRRASLSVIAGVAMTAISAVMPLCVHDWQDSIWMSVARFDRDVYWAGAVQLPGGAVREFFVTQPEYDNEIGPLIRSAALSSRPHYVLWYMDASTGVPFRCLSLFHTCQWNIAKSLPASIRRGVPKFVLSRVMIANCLADIAIFSLSFWGVWQGSQCWRQRRRRMCGLCAACGYDMRGCATCPECGHVNPFTGMDR